MKKRILSLSLALVMILALVPSVAMAAPVVAPGHGVFETAVTDAWAMGNPFDNGEYTSYNESKDWLAFSVSVYGVNEVIITLDASDNLSLRDTRVFLNQVGVPMRYTIPGDCTYYDGLSFYELFDMDVKSIVIPTNVLLMGDKVGDWYYSDGTIEVMDNAGIVTIYGLMIAATQNPPYVETIAEFPFNALINATDVFKRSGPSIDSKSLGKFNLGEEVTVTAIDDNWATLLYNGEVIYVHKAYLNKPYETSIDGYLLTDALLASSYTVDGISLARLPKGTFVKILGREGVCFLVQIGDTTGYVIGNAVQTW